MNWVTLDGVIQGPGRPDEDTRNGFAHGGWGVAYSDESTVAKMGDRMGGDRAFLFGRRTCEQLFASWNTRGGPFKDALNSTRKYVASGSPATRLDWPNSTLLHGDVPAAVAEVQGPQEALESIDALSLDGYYLYHAIRADLLRRLGRLDDATAAYSAAIDRTDNATEIRFLNSRIATIRDGVPRAGDAPPRYA